MAVNARAVSFLNGIVLCGLAVTMLIPLVYDIAFCFANNIWIFIPSITICLFFGISTILSCRVSPGFTFSRQDIYLVVVCFWLVIAFFSAFPFYFSQDCKLSFVSALFESTSGITTTGATVYGDVEKIPESLMLWRFILHFIGGVGIVAIAIVALPMMRIGGMQLFQTENSDKSQKILPRVSQIAAFFIFTYVLIIGIFAILLNIYGMTPFDSICHSISAIATGGFSTKNAGIASFDSRKIEFIIGIAMFVGGITFFELVNTFKNGFRSFCKNQQTRLYIKLVCGIVAVFIVVSFIQSEDNISVKNAVSLFFELVSALTTTGFNLTDGSYFNSFFKIFFFVLPMIGGCSGSTTGGVKLFRLQIMYEVIKTHMKHLINPFSVVVPKYQGSIIQNNVVTSIVTFFVLLVISFILSVFAVCILSQNDIGVCVGAVCACLFNSGFTIDFLTTSQMVYVDMNVGVKVVLMFDMLIGRLEVIPMFMIFTTAFWKKTGSN